MGAKAIAALLLTACVAHCVQPPALEKDEASTFIVFPVMIDHRFSTSDRDAIRLALNDWQTVIRPFAVWGEPDESAHGPHFLMADSLGEASGGTLLGLTDGDDIYLTTGRDMEHIAKHEIGIKVKEAMCW